MIDQLLEETMSWAWSAEKQPTTACRWRRRTSRLISSTAPKRSEVRRCLIRPSSMQQDHEA